MSRDTGNPRGNIPVLFATTSDPSTGRYSTTASYAPFDNGTVRESGRTLNSLPGPGSMCTPAIRRSPAR